MHAHATGVPRERCRGHRLGALSEGKRVEHAGCQIVEAARGIAHHFGAGVHALDAGADPFVVARPENRIVDVVQVQAGDLADRAATLDHGDVQRRIGVAQQSGHD